MNRLNRMNCNMSNWNLVWKDWHMTRNWPMRWFHQNAISYAKSLGNTVYWTHRMSLAISKRKRHFQAKQYIQSLWIVQNGSRLMQANHILYELSSKWPCIWIWNAYDSNLNYFWILFVKHLSHMQSGNPCKFRSKWNSSIRRPIQRS